jgi:hypothetical protein
MAVASGRLLSAGPSLLGIHNTGDGKLVRSHPLVAKAAVMRADTAWVLVRDDTARPPKDDAVLLDLRKDGELQRVELSGEANVYSLTLGKEDTALVLVRDAAGAWWLREAGHDDVELLRSCKLAGVSLYETPMIPRSNISVAVRKAGGATEVRQFTLEGLELAPSGWTMHRANLQRTEASK